MKQPPPPDRNRNNAFFKDPEGKRGKKNTSPDLILGDDITTPKGEDPRVRLSLSERLRGSYVLGKAGSGKTNLLISWILQDIKAGRGVAVIDPHGGDMIKDILRRMPDERKEDVIYLDPLDKTHSFGINIFECDPDNMEQVEVTVSYILELFASLFTKEGDFLQEAVNMGRTLRPASYTFIDNYPMYGMTLAELPLLIKSEVARAKLLQNISPFNGPVHDFWNEYLTMDPRDKFNLTSSTKARSEQFVMNRYIRHVVGQRESTINFREIMDADRGKIVLVPLPREHKLLKNLIGALLIIQILQAAFSRIDIPKDDRKPFFLYIDELGLFSSPAFADMIGSLFAESRKFKLGFIAAHQWRHQLDIDTRKATLNAANLFVFSVSGEDAQEMSKQLDHSPRPGEPQEAYKRRLSPTPVDTVVLGKPHTQDIVNDYCKTWRETVLNANTAIREHMQGGRAIHIGRGAMRPVPAELISNRDVVEEAQEGMDKVNGFLYTVMKTGTPRQVVPVSIMDYEATRGREKRTDRLVQNQVHASLIERLIPKDDSSRRWEVQMWTQLGITECPTDCFLHRFLYSMHTDSLYTRLWTVADKDLPNAFVALETALRGFLLDDIQKSFTTFIENFHFDRQTHDIRIEEEGYQFFQYCLDAYKSAYKLQWLNPASLQWKKDIQYIEGDKDEEVQASPIWRLFPGQKKRWLHSPHLQEQMEHVIACYKLELEQLVHTYRDVISAIVHEPIEILSSVIEEKPTELPTAEVLNRMANELTNPKEKYIAKAKLATTEYTLTAPDLPPRVSEKEYTDRKKNILENTRREHMKLREDIDREIKERHARLTEPEPKLHAKHEEEIIPPEEPRKKARTEE